MDRVKEYCNNNIPKKYHKWVKKIQKQDKIELYDLHKFDIIKTFDTLCNKKLIKNTDLYSYKTIENLFDTVKQYENTKTKGEQKNIDKCNKKVILDNKKLKVILPTAKEAAIWYGKNTNWCISGSRSNNYFESYFYQKLENIYIVIDKVNNKKYAIQVSKNGKMTCWNEIDKIIPIPECIKNWV